MSEEKKEKKTDWGTIADVGSDVLKVIGDIIRKLGKK